MNRSRLAERLKEAALREGFDLAGVATLGPAATAPAYRDWIARGDQAGMAWMERHAELRCDPRLLLPGAMSALVVAVRYGPRPESSAEAGTLWPRVARYARGDDYHGLVRDRLARVGAEVEALVPDCRWRACVDTAPLLERDLAVRAGLGAFGKNTLLLNPNAGSWLLLGELLLTVDLTPDTPLADLCGDCTRCLDACPTGALPAPYRLDARRCISYWTIEHRGEIPSDMRPHLRDWVFGCDICQEVCPWNQGAEEIAAPEFAVADSRRDLDLEGLLRLDPEAYGARLRGSPLRRAKLEGLQRNARHCVDEMASKPRD